MYAVLTSVLQEEDAPKQTWRHTFKAWTFCGQASGHSYALAEGGFRDTRDHVDQKGAAAGTRADVVLSQTLHPTELKYLSTEWAPSGTLWRLLRHRCNPTRQRHWKLSSTSLEGLGVI